MSQKISFKLEDVARREIGIEMDKEHQHSDWSGEISPEMLDYAAKDSKVLLPIAQSLEYRIKDADLVTTMEIEHRALPAVVWMSNAGVPFDSEGWSKRLEEVDREKDASLDNLNEIAPEKSSDEAWNWNSPAQVKEAFGSIGINLENTRETTLARHDHPLAKALVDYRRVYKMISTYGKKLLDKVEGGRIYASWGQMRTATGRMICSSPNLQNLLPEVRRYISAPEGKVLVKADYSQIELRIAAKIADDERMLEA